METLKNESIASINNTANVSEQTVTASEELASENQFKNMWFYIKGKHT